MKEIDTALKFETENREEQWVDRLRRLHRVYHAGLASLDRQFTVDWQVARTAARDMQYTDTINTYGIKRGINIRDLQNALRNFGPVFKGLLGDLVTTISERHIVPDVIEGGFAANPWTPYKRMYLLPRERKLVIAYTDDVKDAWGRLRPAEYVLQHSEDANDTDWCYTKPIAQKLMRSIPRGWKRKILRNR